MKINKKQVGGQLAAFAYVAFINADSAEHALHDLNGNELQGSKI